MSQFDVTLAHSLLNTSLELIDLTTGRDQWNEEALKDNPPRYLRFQRIQILLRLLELKVDLAQFVEGEFVMARGHEESQSLVHKIRSITRISAKKFKAKYYAESSESKPQRWLQRVFQRLLNYRIHADILLQAWSGVLEADAPTIFCFHLARKVNGRLQGSLKQVVDILTLIIDPTLRQMSWQELSKKHGYPSLGDVDIDWL
jgi:hypothetical protein